MYSQYLDEKISALKEKEEKARIQEEMQTSHRLSPKKQKFKRSDSDISIDPPKKEPNVHEKAILRHRGKSFFANFFLHCTIEVTVTTSYNRLTWKFLLLILQKKLRNWGSNTVTESPLLSTR